MSTDLANAVAGPAARSGPHLVVGVDGSVGGWSALAWAREEAAAVGGRLTICRAGQPPPGGATINALELVDPVFARFVHHTVRWLGGQRVAVRIVPGDPVEVLRTVARGADEVVVGVSEPPRQRGSAAVRVATGAAMPVVVARQATAGTRGPFAGHVLAAIAGADVDASVLSFAFGYAAAHGLPLSAVHVIPHADDGYWFDERTLETHFVKEPDSLGLLSAAVEPFRPRYPEVPVRLAVLAGAPSTRLLRASPGVRLTVVGGRTHWRGNPLPGSVTHALTTDGEGPLAIVPAGWVHRRP